MKSKSHRALISICVSGVMICFALAAGPANPATAQEPKRLAITTNSQEHTEAEAPPSKIYDEKADAKADINAALGRAKMNHSRVLIQWGANWCGWCRLLHHLFESDPEIRHELLYEYEIVLVDIGKWDKNRDLAKKYGADLENNGVPFLTILDSDGKVVINQESGTLETKSIDKTKNIGHDRKKVLAFLTAHQADAANAEDVLVSALSTAAREDKLIFLHFGAPWCGWCHRLENWMARPEIEEILAKQFVDTKIDSDRFIGGADMLKKFRGSEGGGIPWFVFLDSKGNTLITSTAPKGNIGFPVQPNEIAHFMEMLRSSAKTLSVDDLTIIEESLKPKPKEGRADG